MRRSGRRPSIPQELIDRGVKEYLTTEKTAREVAEEVGLNHATLLYHVNKYRKEHGETWQ